MARSVKEPLILYGAEVQSAHKVRQSSTTEPGRIEIINSSFFPKRNHNENLYFIYADDLHDANIFVGSDYDR